VITWLGYALQEVQAREASLGSMASQRWEQSLGDLQRPAAPGSLIPMFEGMVDRAFSRSGGDSEPVPSARQMSSAKPTSVIMASRASSGR
jgi:hypothetical protein